MAICPSCWKWCERTLRRVDREVREVGAAQPLQLRIQIGEVAALQQRVVGEVDAGRNILRHERDLLGLREEIVRHAVQHQSADGDRGHEFFGDDLGGVEHVEIEVVSKLLVEQLHPQLPLGKVAGLDRVPQGRGDENPDRRR